MPTLGCHGPRGTSTLDGGTAGRPDLGGPAHAGAPRRLRANVARVGPGTGTAPPVQREIEMNAAAVFRRPTPHLPPDTENLIK